MNPCRALTGTTGINDTRSSSEKAAYLLEWVVASGVALECAVVQTQLSNTCVQPCGNVIQNHDIFGVSACANCIAENTQGCSFKELWECANCFLDHKFSLTPDTHNKSLVDQVLQTCFDIDTNPPYELTVTQNVLISVFSILLFLCLVGIVLVSTKVLD